MRFSFSRPRFDSELKALCQRAEALARSYQHDYIGVEHYFLSLRDLSPDHPALRILTATQLDLVKFWLELETESRIVTGRPVPASLPQTPRAKIVFDLAISFARFEKRPAETGIIHFLFAVAHEGGSVPATLLAREHASHFPRYEDYDLLAARLIGAVRFESRGFLAFPRSPKNG